MEFLHSARRPFDAHGFRNGRVRQAEVGAQISLISVIVVIGPGRTSSHQAADNGTDLIRGHPLKLAIAVISIKSVRNIGDLSSMPGDEHVQVAVIIIIRPSEPLPPSWSIRFPKAVAFNLVNVPLPSLR